jgi:hypothetical protein
MSEYHVKMLKNLDKVLFEDVGETPAEVRQRLEKEGVDVKALVARIKSSAGAAYRELLAEQAKEKQLRTATSKGHIFGSLVGLGRDKLLELVDAAAGGQFGPEVMARCRNQDPEKLSEDDLRTLLEDIESTIGE